MLKLGLTGGMGSGKSTAGKLFEARGFGRIDADVVVRQLLDGDEEVRASLREHFGPELFGAGGELQRGQLAKIVFSDPVELDFLENLLHPRVGAHWRATLSESPERNWVVEIPLLFEKNLESQFDFVITLFVQEELLVKRLLAKGFDQETIFLRIKRQLPIQEKADRADFVLLNQGRLQFLEAQIDSLLSLPALKEA